MSCSSGIHRFCQIEAVTVLNPSVLSGISKILNPIGCQNAVMTFSIQLHVSLEKHLHLTISEYRHHKRDELLYLSSNIQYIIY